VDVGLKLSAALFVPIYLSKAVGFTDENFDGKYKFWLILT